MSGLEVLVLGVGNSYSELHYTTSFVVSAGSKHVLVECPAVPMKVLMEAGIRSGKKISISDIDDIIVTHLHGDHSDGLETFGFWKYFEGKKKPNICSSREVFSELWERKLKCAMGVLKLPGKVGLSKMRFDDYFTKTVLEEGRVSNAGGMSVETKRTKHIIPSFALRISYGGKSIGYSSDTPFDPGVIDFLKGCDVIFHESGYGIHAGYGDLAKLPEKIRSKMFLIHYPDEYAGKKLGIKLLEEGKVISL